MNDSPTCYCIHRVPTFQPVHQLCCCVHKLPCIVHFLYCVNSVHLTVYIHSTRAVLGDAVLTHGVCVDSTRAVPGITVLSAVSPTEIILRYIALARAV